MTTEKDNRSLIQRAKDLEFAAEELTWEVTEEERQHRDEVHRLNCALTQKAAEVDGLTRAGNRDIREELDRVKAELAAEKIRAREKEQVQSKYIATLQAAKDKAFRQLADQRIIEKALEQHRKVNLTLCREREAALVEIERLKAQLDRPTTKGGYHIDPDFKTAQPQPEAKVDGAWVIVRDTTQEFWTGSSWDDNVLLARRWSFDPSSHDWCGAHSVFVPGLSINRGGK